MKNPLTMLKDLAAQLGLAKTALAQVRDAEACFRRRLAELGDERSRLASALPPREEVEAGIVRDVDRVGAAWRAQHGLGLAHAAAGRVDISPADVVEGVNPGDTLLAFTAWPGIALDFAALAGLAPDLLKAGLTAAIAGVDYEPGPSMATRPDLLAGVDRQIADVERQHAALVDEALVHNVRLEHLPEERARRVAAERRKQEAEVFNRANAAAIRRGGVQPMVVPE